MTRYDYALNGRALNGRATSGRATSGRALNGRATSGRVLSGRAHGHRDYGHRDYGRGYSRHVHECVGHARGHVSDSAYLRTRQRARLHIGKRE